VKTNFSFLLTLGLLWSPKIMAQTQTRSWESGKLTWSDFRAVPTRINEAMISYQLGAVPKKSRQADTVYKYLGATCLVDQTQSWAAPNFRTPQGLRYLQLVFDLAELNRRALQASLYQARWDALPQALVEQHLAATNARVARLARETDSGQDSVAIGRWESMVANELATISEPPLPHFTKRKFNYGMYTGLVAGQFFGQTGKHFSAQVGLHYGFVFGYQKLNLLFDAQLATGRVKEGYLGATEWYLGQRAGVAVGSVSLDYVVADTRRVRLMPLVGIGLLEVSRREDPKDPQTSVSLLDNYNYTLGIQLDYKLEKRAKLPSPVTHLREYMETSLCPSATGPCKRGYAPGPVRFVRGWCVWLRTICPHTIKE
jgi:hypothetical protein